MTDTRFRFLSRIRRGCLSVSRRSRNRPTRPSPPGPCTGRSRDRTASPWAASRCFFETTSPGSRPRREPTRTAGTSSSTFPSTPTRCTSRSRVSGRPIRPSTSGAPFPQQVDVALELSSRDRDRNGRGRADRRPARDRHLDVAHRHRQVLHRSGRRPPSRPAAMEEILTSTPGFAKDENGRFHFQGAHSQAEFVIDGQTISDQTGVTFSNSHRPGHRPVDGGHLRKRSRRVRREDRGRHQHDDEVRPRRAFQGRGPRR